MPNRDVVNTVDNVQNIADSVDVVQERSRVMKEITNEVVARHSADMDEFVQNVKSLLDRIRAGNVAEISDRVLELNTIKLPVLMYFANEGLENLGCESDVAKAQRAAEYNEILMRTTGTIPHRQAMAENQTFYAGMAETVYARAYKMLKGKVDMADKIFSALKKVLSKRMLELDISRREVQGNYDGIEDVEEIRGEVGVDGHD